MSRYACNNDLAGTQQAMSSSFKTLVDIRSTTGALTRGDIYDILVGTNGVPADNYMEFDLSLITAVGTSTGITPQALDPADVVALATASANATAEPTTTAASTRWFIGVNQRASYRWVAAPGGELVWPATADDGITGVVQAGTTTDFSATLHVVGF